MRTIAKNRTAYIENIFAHATNSCAYRLENGFIGQPVDPRCALEILHRFSFARLKEERPGRFCVQVHSNEWYEFDSA